MNVLKYLMVAAALTVSAFAARIEIQVRVPGWSEWVRLQPGANTGGHVLRINGQLVTDRAEYLEKVRFVLTPDASIGEPAQTACWWGLYNASGIMVDETLVVAPYTTKEFTVPVNVRSLIVHVDSLFAGSYTQVRVPIGTRP